MYYPRSVSLNFFKEWLYVYFVQMRKTLKCTEMITWSSTLLFRLSICALQWWIITSYPGCFRTLKSPLIENDISASQCMIQLLCINLKTCHVQVPTHVLKQKLRFTINIPMREPINAITRPATATHRIREYSLHICIYTTKCQENKYKELTCMV